MRLLEGHNREKKSTNLLSYAYLLTNFRGQSQAQRGAFLNIEPQVVRSKIWLIAWPLILSNITQPLLGLVDTALLGHLPSQAYIGACAVGASILAFLFWGFGFLRMGTTSLVARATGRNQPVAGEKALFQNCLIALTLAIMLILLAPYVLVSAVNAMGASAIVTEHAISYTQIRLWAAPATLLNYVFLGWFIGVQRTKLPLLVLLITNAANIGLDLLFIVHWDFRSDGAAWASLIGEYLGLTTSIYLYSRFRPKVQFAAIRREPGNWRSLFALNQHLFFRTAALMAVFVFFTSQSAKFGDNVLAANAILLQLVHLASYALDGLAHATETLAGHAAGKRKHHIQLWLLLREVALISGATACCLSFCFWLFKGPLISLFSNIASVQTEVNHYFIWCILVPMISVAAYVLDGYCIGVGETKAMRDSLLASLILVFLPVWWLTIEFNNHGLWLAFCLFNLARGISLGYLVIPTLRSQLRQT